MGKVKGSLTLNGSGVLVAQPHTLMVTANEIGAFGLPSITVYPGRSLSSFLSFSDSSVAKANNHSNALYDYI